MVLKYSVILVNSGPKTKFWTKFYILDRAESDFGKKNRLLNEFLGIKCYNYEFLLVFLYSFSYISGKDQQKREKFAT